MSGQYQTGHPGDVAVQNVPPMRDLAFSMLSLLIEAAATQLRVNIPGVAEVAKPAQTNLKADMVEARAAIDAANALLASVRAIMELDALRAIESMLTQLQIEYVRRVGRSS